MHSSLLPTLGLRLELPLSVPTQVHFEVIRFSSWGLFIGKTTDGSNRGTQMMGLSMLCSGLVVLVCLGGLRDLDFIILQLYPSGFLSEKCEFFFRRRSFEGLNTGIVESRRGDIS